ncbi:hypothetical protein ILUMI_26321 [Ignelater luminosus]|uniref:adenylate cyclase n=1 Tax=Ignelater luminosus TaxID=2038154 RepID=A0A8K0C4H3_IGNLU|nr:hypothetical protein ILUMI_26321 [Ignelater luminosus]
MAVASTVGLISPDAYPSSDGNSSERFMPLKTNETYFNPGRSFKDQGGNSENATVHKQEIVLNLVVTATVHHNITFNDKSDSSNDNHCNETCLKHVRDVFRFKDVNYTDIIVESADNKTNLTDFENNINKNFYVHSVSKRSIIGAYENVSRIVPFDSEVPHINEFFKCSYPEYVVFCWVLCLIALATALKLYYLIKTFLAVLMVASYTFLILVPYDPVFNYKGPEPEDHDFVPLSGQMLILMAIFFLMVAYHARLVEVTSRLDFLWKQQAERELADMQETRHNNNQLLKNILPDHVAKHFLRSERLSDELYSQYRDEVGVLFASIPNFIEFYSEDINKGMECIRLLNEIIADFDELLDEPRFSTIEKIKTVSATATYMAASGLNPKHKDCRNTEGPEHLCALIDFAIMMKQRLEDVNTHSFNNFGLRVGVSCGPLVCGVIGARKPVFDVWGNTVNEASRMDSTGEVGKIQVPKYTAQLLGVRGYELKLRGLIEVKGKGKMETYFVVGRHSGRPPGFQRQPSQYSSLAAVVYAMAQARRKQTGNTPGSGAMGRAKSQQRGDSFGKKIFPNYSSMRISHRTPANPVRRNTTRAHRCNLHARSQPNMRQFGSGTNLENSKSYKSIDRDTPVNALPRMTVSQSAPHTPVSASNHSDGQVLRSVPRLLSEPMVSSQTRNSSPGIKSLDNKVSKSDRNSPYLQDAKKLDSADYVQVDGIDAYKNLKVPGASVPIHSPRSLTKRDSKFQLKSPLVKRDTKSKLENVNSVPSKFSADLPADSTLTSV